MTPKQRITLQADWWPAACRAQGWKASDRELRLRVCSWAVSLDNPSQQSLVEAIRSDRQPARLLESTNDLDNRDDVDRVKNCLGMLADDLKRTGEVGRPQFGSARRKRDLIRSHLKCLALFQEHPRRFLASLVNDMFNHGRPGVTVKDLTDDPQIYIDKKSRQPYEGISQLDRLMRRMSKVVNDRRNENVLVPAWAHLQGTEPMTIHEMKLTAGVRCDCAICSRLDRGQLLPPIPVEENWQDFDPELETVTDEFGGSAGNESGDPF